MTFSASLSPSFQLCSYFNVPMYRSKHSVSMTLNGEAQTPLHSEDQRSVSLLLRYKFSPAVLIRGQVATSAPSAALIATDLSQRVQNARLEA